MITRRSLLAFSFGGVAPTVSAQGSVVPVEKVVETLPVLVGQIWCGACNQYAMWYNKEDGTCMCIIKDCKHYLRKVKPPVLQAEYVGKGKW